MNCETCPRREQPELIDRLTNRQKEILVLITAGYDGPELADALNIKISSVHSHKVRIYKVLEVNSSAEAAVIAVKSGLVK